MFDAAESMRIHPKTVVTLVSGSRAVAKLEGGRALQDHDNRPVHPDVIGEGAPRCRLPQLLPSSDAVAAYRLVHGRLDALLRGRAGVAEMVVPACPGWTVRKTVAHLAGVAQDIGSLNLDGAGTDSWTRAQVDRLGDNSIDDVLDLWSELIDPMTATLGHDGLESPAGQVVFDALSHEHDLRGALGEPGSRTGDRAFEVAAGFLTTRWDLMIRQTGGTSLGLTTPTTGCLQLGDPDTATVHLSLDIPDFEALRAFGGRRSTRQLLALPWSGDPTNLVAAFGNASIRPPHDDLIE